MKVTSPQAHHRTYLLPGTTTHLPLTHTEPGRRRKATFRGQAEAPRPAAAGSAPRPLRLGGWEARRVGREPEDAGGLPDWQVPPAAEGQLGTRNGRETERKAPARPRRKIGPNSLPLPKLKTWSGCFRQGPGCSGVGRRTGNAAPSALTASADNTGTSSGGRSLRTHLTLREISARLPHAAPLEPSRVLRHRPTSLKHRLPGSAPPRLSWPRPTHLVS